MSFKFTIPALALAAAALAVSVPAAAAEPVYAPVGTPNGVFYSFEAAGDGDLTAFYLGGFTRSFTSRLKVFVNGSQLGPAAFNTQFATPGSSFTFGSVSEGDKIEFVLDILAPPSVSNQEIWSTIGQSTPGSDDDGLNQIFSESWGGGAFTYADNGFGTVMNGMIPAGDYTFVAFEDILGFQAPPRNGGQPGLLNDFDYNDHRFAFANVLNVIPEPATWAMMITGFGLVGFAMRRRKASLSSVSA